MIKEFKEFVMKGNVVDMAVGIIIGAAFGRWSRRLNDVLMLPIGLLLGNVDFSNLFINLSGKTFEGHWRKAKKAVRRPTTGFFLTRRSTSLLWVLPYFFWSNRSTA